MPEASLCICTVSLASAQSYLHLHSLTCICTVSPASAQSRLHLHSLACICTVSPASAQSASGERGGSVVECRTPEREVRGSRLTAAVLCPWARHFTPRKYWLTTQEAMALSRHDWKIVDWGVKPQHNQPTVCICTVSPASAQSRLYLHSLACICTVSPVSAQSRLHLHSLACICTVLPEPLQFTHTVKEPEEATDIEPYIWATCWENLSSGFATS